MAPNAANYVSLTPLSFLERASSIFPDRTAIIDDDRTLSYRQFRDRCVALASALDTLGVGVGDTVAFLCYNSHELLEAHYFVPMAGAILNALNTRLDARTLSFILEHSESRVLFYDAEFESIVHQAVRVIGNPPKLVAIRRADGTESTLAALDYETLCTKGDSHYQYQSVTDEWQSISLNYTSGTTGNPKGVLYHHRGAWLTAMSNAMAMEMSVHTVYLWTLPMFHCNGWAYTWAVTAVCGTHVCLRKFDVRVAYEKMQRHGVTDMCGAPIVLNRLVNELHDAGLKLDRPVKFSVGGAAPPSAVIQRGREIGLDVIHLYGLTETYGPATVCVRQPSWEGLPLEALATQIARQGVRTHSIEKVTVANAESLEPVPADGRTLGEIMLRGNNIMKGYLKNPSATAAAFRGGWLHTGDLGVMHPDGYIEVKDRSKDIIISGGENISSKEIEEALYRHPDVREAAVVAMADDTWGEVPCAFIELRSDRQTLDEASIIAFCKQNLPSYKAPRKVVFGELPKTSTGKIRKNILRENLQAKQ